MIPDLEPFTNEQRAAIRECRWYTTNAERSFAWAWTMDIEIAKRVGFAATAFKRSRNSDVIEYEIRIGHPDAVAYIADLQDARAAA